MDSHEMRQRAGAARVARLATAGADGAPHIVPFAFALWGETLFSAVDHKPKSGARLKRLENIEHEPRVAVLVDEYDDDWERLWWVRLDGRARIVASQTERARATALLVAKYEQYAEHPLDGEMFAVDVERWSGWSA
jgi:PPOX class probable F420-dependent enzyme